MPLGKAANLSQQVADHLSDRIIRCELKPGQHLRENELAKELGVSTNTLREAFRLMEKHLLVTIAPKKGVNVTEVSERQVEHLYDFLFMLFAQLAKRVARTWQADDLAEMAELVQELGQRYNRGDVGQFHEFAFQVIAAARRFEANEFLLDAIDDLMPQLKRYSYMALLAETSEIGKSLELFQSMLGNIAARNPQGAAADIRKYGEAQCAIVLSALNKQAID